MCVLNEVGQCSSKRQGIGCLRVELNSKAGWENRHRRRDAGTRYGRLQSVQSGIVVGFVFDFANQFAVQYFVVLV